MGSLETILNTGFQAVQGQTYETALLKAADFGQTVMIYIGISIWYFPKLCLGLHQILNLCHPKKGEQSWVNREKLECQENLTGRLVRRNMEEGCCLRDDLFHFELKSVVEEYWPCRITESVWWQHVQWLHMSVVSPYAVFLPTGINIQGLFQVHISVSAPIYTTVWSGTVTKPRAVFMSLYFIGLLLCICVSFKSSWSVWVCINKLQFHTRAEQNQLC